MQSGPYSIQNNAFYLQQPEYRLDPFRPPTPPDPGWLLRAPSRLLDARAELVGFTGREEELRDLAQWRDGPAGFLAARLVHGLGGQGKTRLANRFAAQSAELGWSVLTARYSPPAAPTAGTSLTAGVISAADPASAVQDEADRVLVVVDYADRWPHRQLVRLFGEQALRRARHPRVLLIGRSVQWWPAIRGELADLRAEADERRLKSLSATVADRERLFHVARDRFAALLADASDGSASAVPSAASGPSGAAQPPSALTDPDNSAYDTVLTVHMAALAAVYAGPAGRPLPDRPEALAAYLLDREQKTWRRLFEAGPPFVTRPRQIARVVFVATLVGAQAYRAGLGVLKATDLEPVQSLLDDHRICYPPFDPGTVLEPLYPDRLAEDFLALSLPGHDGEGYDPDPWARDALTGLLARGADGAAPGYTARSVTFLAAAAVRWPHVAAIVDVLLRDDPGLAIDAGGIGLRAVAEIPALSTDVLDAVINRFPDTREVDLDAGMASVMDRRTHERLGAAKDEASRLVVLLDPDIPFRLISAGRYQDAVDALRTSIPWWRRLAGGGDRDNARFLAGALTMLGSALAHRGQLPEALEAARESVELHRRCSPGTGALASALVNYSSRLLTSRHVVEAAQAAAEAARLYQAGAARDEVDTGNLALALSTRSRALAEAGRTGPALKAVEAALELWRGLAAARPQAFEPDLALALHSAAQLWAVTGERHRALAASLESAAIHRRMADANPAAHRSALAGVLTDLGRDLAAAGRDAEALEVSFEAVALRRALAAQDPAAHESGLAGALNNHGSRLRALGHQEDSLTAIREAAEIQQRLAAAAPDTEEPALALMLINLGRQLDRDGQPAQALPLLRRAVAIRRRLAATGIASDQADLAHSLDRLAAVCVDAGRIEEGIDAAAEAVEGYLELSGVEPGAGQHTLVNAVPDMYKPALAGALMTLHRCLNAASRSEQALDACERSVYLLLSLAVSDPPRFEPDLAAAFTDLSGALTAVGRGDEAGRTAQNAVMIYRQLAQDGTARYNRRLAIAHQNLAVALSRHPDPLFPATAGAEAVKDLRRLSESDPEFLPDLAMALGKLSIALITLGRWNDAFATAEEAAALRRRLIRTDPASHEPHLARLLRGLATALFAAGVAPAQAVAMARESLAIYRRLADRDHTTYGAECQQATAALTLLLNGV